MSFNLEGGLGVVEYYDDSEGSSNDFVWIGGDYYFNRKLSMGAAYQISRGDYNENEGKIYGIRGTAFLTKRMSLYLGYAEFDADSSEGDDGDTYYLRLAHRF